MSNQVKLDQLKNADKPAATTEIVKSGFFSVQGFELMQRVAMGFAKSDLVPEAYRGNISNCLIALDMADRIGAAPLSVMQSMYIVHGNPAWSSKFLIATVNACGRYSSLRYEWKGKPGANDYGCRAWAIERETGQRLDGIWVTWELVKEEGWDSKKGSKWKTMPDQMFIYRAATFWQRAYAPELAMGLGTVEEAVDVYDASMNKDGSYSVDIDTLRKDTKEVVNKATGEILEQSNTHQIKQPGPETETEPEDNNNKIDLG